MKCVACSKIRGPSKSMWMAQPPTTKGNNLNCAEGEFYDGRKKCYCHSKYRTKKMCRLRANISSAVAWAFPTEKFSHRKISCRNNLQYSVKTQVSRRSHSQHKCDGGIHAGIYYCHWGYLQRQHSSKTSHPH